MNRTNLIRRVLSTSLFCIVLIAFVIPSASAAKGEVKNINMPQNHGSITRDDDGTCNEYQFKIPEDLADPDFHLEEGTKVEFDISHDNSRHATNVRMAEGDPTDPGDPGEIGVCEPSGEIVLPPGLDKRGSLPPGWDVVEIKNIKFPDDPCDADPPPLGPIPIPYPCIGLSK